MAAHPEADWPEQADDPDIRIDGCIDPAAQEAYWRSAWWTRHGCRAGLDYEDYVPAYCVGYVGFAQYGGRYEDARGSLCANWVRIKGGSRLSLEEALQAIRAAWDHAARAPAAAEEAVDRMGRVPARREPALAAA